jgi:hypothetical protein
MNSSNLNGRKLYIGPKAFRRGSKTKKWQIEAKPTRHLFWRENQIGSDQKTVQKGELQEFGEPRIRLETKVQANSRIQFASNQSKLVPRKLDPGSSSKVVLSFLLVSLCIF